MSNASKWLGLSMGLAASALPYREPVIPATQSGRSPNPPSIADTNAWRKHAEKCKPRPANRRKSPKKKG